MDTDQHGNSKRGALRLHGACVVQRVRRGAVVLAVALMGLAGLATPALAQDTTTFVSNLDQASATQAVGPEGTIVLAQQFTTGTEGRGYKLSAITVDVQAASNGTPSFALYTSTASNEPGSKVTDLTGSVASVGEQTFTSSSTTILRASTKYFIWFEATAPTGDSTGVGLRRTESAMEDSGNSENWSIANEYLFRDGSTNPWNTATAVPGTIKVDIKGTVNDKPTGARAPGIVGIEQVGQTLRAAVGNMQGCGGCDSSLAYRNGSFQWVRNASPGEWKNISGATGRTYTLATADAGKQVRLEIRRSGHVYRSFAYPLHSTIRAAGVPALTAVEVTSTPKRTWNTYGTGERIDFTARFSGSVDITGTPDLRILIGSQGRHATYRSGSGTDAIVFSYTVRDGDTDLRGVTVESGNGLGLNAGRSIYAGHDWAMSSVRLQSGEAIRTKGGTADALLTNNHWNHQGVTFADHKVRTDDLTATVFPRGYILLTNLTKGGANTPSGSRAGFATSFKTSGNDTAEGGGTLRTIVLVGAYTSGHTVSLHANKTGTPDTPGTKVATLRYHGTSGNTAGASNVEYRAGWDGINLASATTYWIVVDNPGSTAQAYPTDAFTSSDGESSNWTGDGTWRIGDNHVRRTTETGTWDAGTGSEAAMRMMLLGYPATHGSVPTTSPDVLVGTLGKGPGSINLLTTAVAQSFSTGAGASTLQRVRISALLTAQNSVSVHSDSSGTPGTRLMTLQPPSSFAATVSPSESVEYSAGTQGLALAANTRYWMVLQGRLTQSFTTDTGEDGMTGWSMGDRYWAQAAGGTWAQATVAAIMRMDILGEVRPGTATQVEEPPPTVSATPSIADPGDGAWSPTDTVQVTVTFSEAVDVDTSDGTPSIEIGLGGPAPTKEATYTSGSGTTQLVFEYTLAADDGSHTSIFVSADSLALNGGTIQSTANDAGATLTHNGAAVQATPSDSGPRGAEGGGDELTASFEAVPAHHDGTAFTFELAFSETAVGSWRTVAGGLLNVTGGAVTHARRTNPNGPNRHLRWTVTVTPSGNGDVSITLPVRACTDANAACADGRPLAREVSATVPVKSLTGRFTNVPAEHTGTGTFTLEFHLSEAPRGMSWRTVRDHLFDVTGGTIENAERAGPVRNRGWKLTVAPAGNGDVTLTLRATTSCDDAHAVCTEEERMLAGGATTTIQGPAALSVADAEVEEAEGATLDFAVTLSRARTSATTVDYGTSDGTATAGADYTATSGTLTFAAGETAKTIQVAVRDDAHDEGDETMTLTLSNASGARIEDAEATGTITNTDPMPRAWMVRFGRTVGSQVVDALTERLDGAAGSHVTVGGVRLGGGPAVEPQAEADDPFALPAWATTTREAETRTMRGRDLLLGSSFHLSSSERGAEHGPAFTAWGRVATGGFETEEDNVSIDGDVTTATVGVDAEWDRLLAGVMLSQSEGDGSYRLDPEHGDDSGTVESSLTGVYPYARIDLNARVSAWALAGAGSGELTLKQKGEKAMPTDISLRMGALGVKGALMEPSEASGLALNLKSDAMWVGTKSERTRDMVATEGDVTRLRLILQGERVFASESGRTFVPSAEVGLRHDGGDAETGTGLEVGAGLRYTAGRVSISGNVRTLVTHEASGYEEWGLSGAIVVSPGSGGRGLTLSLRPEWGRTGSASEMLWSARDAGTLVGGEFEAERRLAMDAGYGFGLSDGRGVLTPYAGMTLGEASSRTMRGGARWQLGPDVAVGVEATRDDAGETSSTGIQLRAALRF